VDAVPVKVVDAIGAGDAFSAGLLKYLAKIPAAQVRAGLGAEDLRAWGAFSARWASQVLRQSGAVDGYAGAGLA
jgi:sugar/nucleoside kinase (ribokinase family)